MYIPVVIHKDADSDYGVTVPDIPGCFSYGETIDEAIKNTQDAITFHLNGLLEDNEKFDFNFRSIESLRNDDSYRNDDSSIFTLVPLDTDNLTNDVVRVNISWPKYLVFILDRLLKKTGETRSGYLAKLVLTDIRNRKDSL